MHTQAGLSKDSDKKTSKDNSPTARNSKPVSQFDDSRSVTIAQKNLQNTSNNSSRIRQLKAQSALMANKPAPIQLSGGSSQANEELVKAMGKGAALVDKVPKAKPHTKTGTGSSGTDHQGRNAMVINKAKRDTMKAHDDPTMFSASRMRGDARGKEKSADAAEKRMEKAAATDHSMADFEKAMVQARTTYKGDQEKFDEYLKNRKYTFTDEQLDALYAEIYKED